MSVNEKETAPWFQPFLYSHEQKLWKCTHLLTLFFVFSGPKLTQHAFITHHQLYLSSLTYRQQQIIEPAGFEVQTNLIQHSLHCQFPNWGLWRHSKWAAKLIPKQDNFCGVVGNFITIEQKENVRMLKLSHVLKDFKIVQILPLFRCITV